MKLNLFWKLITPLLVISIASMVVISFTIPSIIKKNAFIEAKDNAEKTVNQFKTIRGYYTKNVVSVVKKKKAGINIAINHKDDPNAIPLPATLIHDLSKLLKKDNVNIKLYSKFPFPNRKSRKLDKFSADAWDTLSKNPAKSYSKNMTLNGKTTLRVAVADLMVAKGCVTCHNNHPDTPKTDWKLNDVRGVLEIETDLTNKITNGIDLSRKILFILVGVTLSLLLSFAVVYHYVIDLRLKRISKNLNNMNSGSGDLTKRLELIGDDELTSIAVSFNLFLDKIHKIILQIKSGSNELSNNIATLEKISIVTEKSINEQINETGMVVTAVTELSAAADEIARNAGSTAEATSDSAQATSAGKNVVDNCVKSTEKLSEEIDKSSEVLKDLNDKNENIKKVLAVISNIAEQTNLLALNASIEAARAGEEGKGFSVVADEVKSLAYSTQEATANIELSLDEFDKTISQLIESMEINLNEAKNTVSFNNEVETHLNKIDELTMKSSELNEMVASASEEQGVTINEIDKNLIQIHNMSTKTIEDFSKVSKAIKQLNAEAERLEKLSSEFKL
ncbi:MAG: chemotaxis protein [Planctomycetota bacterium]|nr:MAG: chemotaxis protein [Planctomycetota bacterium]